MYQRFVNPGDDECNLQVLEKVYLMGSGFSRKICTSAHIGGQVLTWEGQTCSLGRAFTTLLAGLDREIEASVRRIFLVLDNASIHRGKQVQAWLAAHPRFVCHFLPVHCSWMNQVEQWFSILQRKRLRISDFASPDHLAERLMAYVSEWNAQAHPFNWSTKSAAKVMAKCEAQAAGRQAA